MFSLKRTHLIFILFLIFVIGAFFYYRDIIVLESNLKDISINNIKVKGNGYSIKKGAVFYQDKPLKFLLSPGQRQYKTQVLQLAAFYTWIKEDPLFVSPELDNQKMAEVVSFLDTQQKKLLERYSISQSITPIKTLQSVVEVKQKHDDLLNTPSWENAEALIDSYKTALTSYKQDLTNTLSQLKKLLADKNMQANIVYIEISTTPEIIIADYEKMLQNASALEEEINKREGCLRGKNDCIRPARSFALSENTTLSTVSNSPLLDQDILFYRVYPYMLPSTITGPFKVATSCYGLNEELNPRDQLFYVKWMLEQMSSTSEPFESMRIKLASQNYYQKLTADRYEDRILINRGLSWRLLGETTSYKCPDLSYQPKVMTLEGFVKQLKEKPLFINSQATGIRDLDDLIAQGKKQEEDLLSSDFPSFEQMQALGKLYKHFYARLGSLDQNSQIRDQFLNSGLQTERLMTNFPFLLTRIASEYFDLEINESLNEAEGDYLFLFLVRSPYSLLYYPSSKSIWRLSDNLNYIQKKRINNTGFDTRYITYQQALTKYKKEEIFSWHIGASTLTRGIAQP